MREFLDHLPFIVCIVGVVFLALGIIRRDWRLAVASICAFFLAMIIERLW
jgi:hypothetical protein